MNYGDLDGVGTNAQFNVLFGLALDEINNQIFIADQINQKIKSLNLSSMSSTPLSFFHPLLPKKKKKKIKKNKKSLKLNHPIIFKNISSILLFHPLSMGKPSLKNSIIQIIDFNVTTVAGNGNLGNIDGSALSAEFSYPFGVAIHPINQLVYILDVSVRILNRTSNMVSTIISNQFNSGQYFSFKTDGSFFICQASSGNIGYVDSLGLLQGK